MASKVGEMLREARISSTCFFLGAVLYIIGSVFFFPVFSERRYTHGVLLFIVGSALFLASALCDLQLAIMDYAKQGVTSGENSSGSKKGDSATGTQNSKVTPGQQLPDIHMAQLPLEGNRVSALHMHDLGQQDKNLELVEEWQSKEQHWLTTTEHVLFLYGISNLLGAAAYLSGSVFYLPDLNSAGPAYGPVLFVIGSIFYMAPLMISWLTRCASPPAFGAATPRPVTLLAELMVFSGALAFLVACAIDLSPFPSPIGGPALPLWLFLVGCIAFLMAACANFIY